MGFLDRTFELKELYYRNLKTFKSLDPAATLLRLDLRGLFTQKGFYTGILTFLFLDVFDTVGTLLGVSERAGLLRDGRRPRAR